MFVFHFSVSIYAFSAFTLLVGS